MNDFEGLLTSDYGFKPQGKSAPMKASGSRSTHNVSNSFDSDSVFVSSKPSKSSNVDDFSDIFGTNSRGVGKSGTNSGFDFDSMFDSSSKSKSSSGLPVFDKPVYDDDLFDGVPGIKTSSSSGGVKYDDVFASLSGSRSGSGSPQKKPSGSSGGGGGGEFDDLLGGFGKREIESKVGKEDRSAAVFDDLIPGFGRATSPNESKQASEPSRSSEPVSSSKKMTDDPFASLGSTSQRAAPSYSTAGADPLEEFSKLGKSESLRSNGPSVSSGSVYDDSDPFDGLGRSYSSERSSRGKDRSPLKTERSTSGRDTYNSKEQADKNFVRSPESENHSKKSFSVDNDFESQQAFFSIPEHKKSSSAGQTASYHEKTDFDEADIPVDSSPKFDEHVESSDEVWLTVAEIPLFTQPTSAPPPSRPPPPRPARVPKASSFGAKNFESPKVPPVARHSVASSMDDLEDFAMGGNRNRLDDQANGFSSEDLGMNLDAAASAAAMKEVMERAEAKFRHAKEVRERESNKAARGREAMQAEVDENLGDDFEQDRLHQEQLQRERERQEEERERRRLEKEREEKEREQRRLERERERERAREERERARQAVERATREARERAAAEARLKAERAAVGKVNAEARERAERAAVFRAQAEARERAAAEAKERAEKAAAEAREREARERAAEARMKAERAAVERAAAEARERAAAEARERAAAAAREKAAASARANQQRNDNDLESFFSTRANSAPRPRNDSADSNFDTQSQGRRGSGAAKTSDATPSSMRKASSTTNIVDDLSSIFGGAPSAGEFPEFEGESEERRRARLERHQRTQERAAKALAEKNQRDLQAQRDQAERHRIAESMDVEIKRWAAGKEGNLRALLSTLQYVLWPECGWQPVSLTDLITAAAVKKVYRKATLCIHPDKVQQKGANLQQKYIAEKVFDLLKEAWNKFNSEELF